MKPSLVLTAITLFSGSLAAAESGQSPTRFRETIFPGEPAEQRSTVNIIKEGMGVNKAASGWYHHGLHAKGHGCIKGRFTVLDDLPAIARYGLFKKPATYKVWARFSNAMANVLSDNQGDLRGFGFKVLGTVGERLTSGGAGEGTSQDFTMFTSSIAFGRHIIGFSDVLKAQLHTQLMPATILKYPDLTWTIPRMFAHGASIANQLETQYWSVAPYQIGPRAMKYSAKPCAPRQGPAPLPALRADRMRAAMKKHLDEKGACFDFMVQFFKDEKTTPLENHLIDWKEKDAPFIKVGRLEFPKQTFDSAAQDKFCENLSINPWRGLTAHRPLGSLNRARKSAYDAAMKLRHQKNKITYKEPTGDETF